MIQFLQFNIRFFGFIVMALLLMNSCSNDDDEFDCLNEVFSYVDQFPRFPGCEHEPGTHEDKEECAKHVMLQYIYKNLKYPQQARDNNVEGMCVVQFVVEIDGSINEAVIMRDIGSGCGEACLAIVESMNNMDEKWIPGKKGSKLVRVQYTLPFRFKLPD